MSNDDFGFDLKLQLFVFFYNYRANDAFLM